MRHDVRLMNLGPDFAETRIKWKPALYFKIREFVSYGSLKNGIRTDVNFKHIVEYIAL